MNNYKSFIAPWMESFAVFQKAAGRWNKTYSCNLIYFDRHCSQQLSGNESLTQELVDNWCAQRPTEINNSCRTRIFVVFNFIRYLRERGLTDVMPPVMPGQERITHLPHAFTDLELERFFKACDNLPSTPRKLTVLARKVIVPVFFRLLYSSGIRTNEARELRVNDVNLSDGVLNVRQSKGQAQHFVVLHDTMLSLLIKYNATVQTLYPQREYFFPSPRNSFLSNSWVVHNFRQLWYKDNTAYATAYQLRHNYAIENVNQWIGEGFELFSKLVYLSKSMGHSSLESTKYYFNLTPVLFDILREKTENDFDIIVPEVDWLEES